MNDESTSTEEGLLFTEASLTQLINHCKTESKNNGVSSEALNNKVDKVEGKGLSTNDYTDAEKEKLAGLSNYDDTSLDNRVTTVENSLSDKVDKDGDKVLSTNDYTDAEKAKLEGLSGRVTSVENTLEDKVDKVEGKGLSTNDYTDTEKSKLAGLSNYDDTILAGKIANIEGIIPSAASSENRLATMEDISGGSEVSVEQKVSEGVNIASITIDGHKTEIFAPEGSNSPSTITIVNPNLYDPSTATKSNGYDYNIYSEISVSPNTDYVFDISSSPYGWAGVRVGNTTIGNNAPDRKIVEFNSGSNTSVRTQFFPGNDTTVAQTDFSNILFYEAGKIPGETTTIENPNSGSGSNLVSTDITEILLTASSQHPIEIVLIGDSITEGYAATGSLNAGSTHPLPTWKNFPSWAGKLNSYITANFPNVTVTNRGYSGQVSSYGASNINSWITNNRQIAIVMFGTNNRTSQANMNSLANDYTTMLNRCRSVGAKMIPMCCIPTTPYNQSISGKYVGTMEQVHNILVNWAKTNGYELLDLYSLMMAYINNNTSNLESMGLIYVGSADNNLHIHPSDAGHAVMFDFIKHKLGIGTAGGSGGGAKYRHRVAMYCLNGGTTYVIVNLYNNRSTPYNAATTTTTDEINAFKADVLAAGYSSALQKGTLMCSGVVKGTHVYGMYMGTSSSGLSAVADKLNFIDGTNFNITLPLETGGTNSASSSLRLWDTVEPA